MDDAVETRSATELAAAIRARELSSEELLDRYLARIDRCNRWLNAVVTIDEAEARATARRLDALAARGEWQGPLHGLPVTVKDALEVAGMRSTGGAVELADHVPSVDAPAVARLRRAGAVVFGKSNCARWSGDIQTSNELFGTTVNPWDPARTPGGSSGGAAAAVAAGLTAFELGTDLGGSIRIPAHCCGVFGLKPTYGVVPQRGYLDRVGGGRTELDINAVGPLARSADDLHLLLDVLAGPDEPASAAWRLDLPAPRRPVGSQRVGVWLPDADEPHDPEQREALERIVDHAGDAGLRIEPAHPPVDRDEAHRVFLTLLAAAVAASAPPDARTVGARSWHRADERRAELRDVWRRWFRDFDVLLCPVMPVPAFEHLLEGDLAERTIEIGGVAQPYGSLVSWTGLVGAVGLPSVVVPIGTTTDGLPIGLQVVAAHYRDREAIELAAALARLPGAGYRMPPLARSGERH